jgi:geranylgeranyl diphosphate synthase type I
MTYSELKKFLNYVNLKIQPAMRELLNSDVDKKNKRAVYYQISTGGKRIRPALAIASCKMTGGKLKDVVYPAASLEILHNFSLIIDDIVDSSPLRRKYPTFWFKYGRSVAQVFSINYAAAIFQKACQWKKPKETSEALARTMKAIVDGEMLDILFGQSGLEEEPFIERNRYREINEKDYYKMASKKTASFIQASCEIGGLAAGANKRQLELLGKYGFNFGMAFQIQDDILDIFGREESFGKKIGNDIIEGKLGNIVILFALKKLSLSDKRRFLKIMRKEEITKKDVRAAIKMIKKTDALSKASTLGKSFVYEAKRQLNLLPRNKWNNTLRVMADFVIEREK